MMSKLRQLQQELAEAEENVTVCNDMLALDPNDADAKETKGFLDEQIADLKAQIAALQQLSAPPPTPPTDDGAPPPPPPAQKPKYDMSKHPKFREAEAPPPPPPPEEQHQQIYNVKDIVQAKYSDDKQWYQATIISKTGSQHDPVYTVTFKGYGNTETKRKHEIRSIHNPNEKKRKADALSNSPATSTPATPASPKPVVARTGGHVISAAPNVDPSALLNQPPKHIPSKVSDGPTRMAPEPKKLKGQKQLQKNQTNWQAWASGGGASKKTGAGAGFAPSKTKKSMFAVSELPGAKVGYTGSGKTMTKDQERKKWNYGAGEDGGD